MEADVKHKIIRDYEVTDASVHDSKIFERILDEKNTSKDVYADSAYRSAEHESKLKSAGFDLIYNEMAIAAINLRNGKNEGIGPVRKCVHGLNIYSAQCASAQEMLFYVQSDWQSYGKTRTSEYRLQHGEILYFDGANRIKWRNNDKNTKNPHKKPVISMPLT